MTPHTRFACATCPLLPRVLHVVGGLDRFLELTARDPVAIVGARAASSYGTGVARSLGAALGRAGVTVLSGMAHGIDSAAHVGRARCPGADDCGPARSGGPALPGKPPRAAPPRGRHRRVGV